MNLESVNIDGKVYLEIDKINVDKVTYAYLVNKDNKEDFCIRRLIFKNDKYFYEGLKDDAEFNLALMYFVKKHENIVKEFKEEV
jgi:hypothetical protein